MLAALSEGGLPLNSGEVTVLLPLTAATPLTPGVYTVVVTVFDGATFFLKQVATTGSAIFKRATNDAPQVMDVTIWVATSSDEVTDAAGRANIEQVWRNTCAAVFGPFSLSIGRITCLDPPAAVVQQYAALSLPTGGLDTALRELCSAIAPDLGQDPYAPFRAGRPHPRSGGPGGHHPGHRGRDSRRHHHRGGEYLVRGRLGQ